MSLENKCIVAIDDTSSIRIFLRISLQAQQVDFHEAGDATSGLALCRDIKPDLVVLDLGLPDKDGLDILPEIKQIRKDGRAPVVIILTVRKEQHVREKAFRLGADGYITKPFMMDDLLDAIEEQLNGEDA